jgi:diguanylate cyclase (GGDEF)-like protein/PAS domain S-box-containing protein
MMKFDFDFVDIVDNASDVIIVTKATPIDEPGPEIVYVNKAFTKLTGYTYDEVIGKTPRILQAEGTDKESRNIIRNALIEKKAVRTTIKNYSKAGREYWLDISILPLNDSAGNASYFVAIERDMTEQKELEKKLEELSKTDPLTSVLNRRAFDEILENEFSRFKRSNENYALLILDIDHFKKVNDNYGHHVGDAVLKEVAKTCQSSLRRHDTVARVGGEEFCIILPYISSDNASKIAEKLREKIMHSVVQSDDNRISVTVSIGVAEVERADTNSSEAMKRADNKLYEAKKAGRNRVCM